MLKNYLCLLFVLSVFTSYGQDTKADKQKQDSINRLKEVNIVATKLLGSKFEARNRTGSAYFLSQERN